MVALAHAPQRAAIYCRVSTSGQEDNFSLATQEAACRRFAEERGYAVAEVYREVFSGAYLWERPQLARLREAARGGAVAVVIAHAIDRLSREQAHLYILDDEWERAGVRMEFVTEQFDTSAVGKVIRSVKAFAAEAEREKFKERSMRGQRARLEAGMLKPGAFPLYGYRWRDATHGAYDPDPLAAPVVRRMFAWSAEGATLREICRRLNDEGVPTYRGAPQWHHNVVSTILNNPAYKGEAWGNSRAVTRVKGRKAVVHRPEAERIRLPDGTVPAIVDADLWEAVQVRMRRNKAEAPRNSRNPRAFLLRGGFVRCGQCGKGVDAVWKKNRSGERVAVYRVLTSGETHRGCPSAQMTARDLDGAVNDYLKLVVTHPDIFTAQIARLRERDTTADDLAAVERSLADVKRQQANLGNALALLDDPDAAAPLVARLKDLSERKRGLEAERAAVLARQSTAQQTIDLLADVRDNAATIAANFDALAYETKRDLLAAIDFRVRIFPSDAPDRYAIDNDLAGLLHQIVCESRP